MRPDWQNLIKKPEWKLRAIYEKKSNAARNAEIGITEDLTHRRRSKKRHYQHMLHVANAAKQLGSLPPAGESLHCIMRGNFNGWDLVPAILRLAAPATIRSLYVATLGFNETNATELVELLDKGDIQNVTFICSIYFRTTSGDVFEYLHHQLQTRGQRALAIRCHAKILLCEMTDGRSLVVESSANLRSCNNIEQFALHHDAELLAFHRSWMDDVAAKSSETPADAPRPPAKTDRPKKARGKPRKAQAKPARAPATERRARASRPPRPRSLRRVGPHGHAARPARTAHHD